ncbi:MAG TPA: GAF domain-containing sensor histidine kinase [Solirubrobacteraceae bacterium]|jgi:signal transduction histidine kinase|nr:GAF domain-containing sensor histidine kinase [Solirubrobacteraceae bacterium]
MGDRAPSLSDESGVLAEEQAALRRVATLVARGVPPEQVLAASTEEICRLLGVEYTYMARYEPGDTLVIVGAWGRSVDRFPPGSRSRLGGKNLVTIVHETARPARIDSYADASGPLGVAPRASGVRSAVAAPITVEGRLWGVVVAGSRSRQPLAPDAESRLANFTELLATAIANAESRAGLARLAEEQAALRRVATLVARGMPPQEVFASVTEEVGHLLAVDYAGLGHYDPDGTLVYVAAWNRAGDPFPPVGTRVPLGGNNVSTLVFESGRPARVDRYADATGPLAASVREEGVRSGVGAPITVEDRLWGMVGVGSILEHPLSPDTEARLASFTKLVATAIGNTESRAALAASRTRIAAAADETRRRIERDLHDGIQQQLVSLILELRAAETIEHSGEGELRAQLARTAHGLSGVLEELREIARGIHPAILSEAGLERALRALARRSAVPVELDLGPGRRLPDHLEAAAYYVVSEALTNAAKHSHASIVRVELESRYAILQITIRDDGIGGADPGQGSGLVGLSDRVEALSGTLQVISPVGGGTQLLVEIPVTRQSSARGAD